MAKPRMDLPAFVGKLLEAQDGDVLREGIRVLSQALMETEVAGLIGAERHERTRSPRTRSPRRYAINLDLRLARRPPFVDVREPVGKHDNLIAHIDRSESYG
jgi:hypothetical protein